MILEFEKGSCGVWRIRFKIIECSNFRLRTYIMRRLRLVVHVADTCTSIDFVVSITHSSLTTIFILFIMNTCLFRLKNFH